MSTNLNLRCDSIYTKPVTIDWREVLGEDCEGYRILEAEECQSCGVDVISNGLGEDQHNHIEPTITIRDLPKVGSDWRCPVCSIDCLVGQASYQ